MVSLQPVVPPFAPLDRRGIAVLDFVERSEVEILEQLGGYVYDLVMISRAYPPRNSKARSSPMSFYPPLSMKLWLWGTTDGQLKITVMFEFMRQLCIVTKLL